MRHIKWTIFIYILLTVQANGQRNDPDYYCQSCCGFMTTYRLVLVDNNSFEIRWTDEDDKNTDDLIYVKGRYNLTDKYITLDIESTREKIELNKLNKSDSLVIHFDIVDSEKGDSIVGTVVNLTESRSQSFVFSKYQGTLRTTFDKNETVLFKMIGMNDLELKVTEPGEYRAKVTLVYDMQMKIKPGDKRTFKRVKGQDTEKLKDLTDRKIKFLTKKCDPIITNAR